MSQKKDITKFKCVCDMFVIKWFSLKNSRSPFSRCKIFYWFLQLPKLFQVRGNTGDEFLTSYPMKKIRDLIHFFIRDTVATRFLRSVEVMFWGTLALHSAANFLRISLLRSGVVESFVLVKIYLFSVIIPTDDLCSRIIYKLDTMAYPLWATLKLY